MNELIVTLFVVLILTVFMAGVFFVAYLLTYLIAPFFGLKRNYNIKHRIK